MSRKSNAARVHVPSWILLAAFLLLITSGAVTARGFHPTRQLISSMPRHAATKPTQKQLSCLPKEVGSEDFVEYGRGSKTRVTVGKKLKEMKARCRRGKLLDGKSREIRFFHISCWGNPPPDYLEIQRREQAELARLKLRYTIIVIGCDPLTL